ncbi:hypothetical protein ACHAWC_003021 [Mediolabrus comicus]
MTSETMNNKRRKTEESVATYLPDLPIGILEHSATFLVPISRALFAIALTNNENNPPRENYSSIAGSDWLPIDFGDIETDLAALTNNENNNLPNENPSPSSIASADDWSILDFGEVEKDLATKLSDDDISSILQHIDAVNKVKRLRLTNCINITGVGLEPLRGSAVIEQIDLSLVGDVIEQIDLSLVGDGENPRLVPEPPISCELVMPVLDSIIERECALKHLQFPYKWLRVKSADSEFHAFIVRYNQMLENRGPIRCLDCNEGLPKDGDGFQWIGDDTSDNNSSYGLQNYTCCQCTKHYCYDCSDEDGITNCSRCQRDYCMGCVKIEECGKCDNSVCEHCFKDKECDKCKDRLCPECVRDRGNECYYCGVLYCNECNDQDGSYRGDGDDGAGVVQVDFCEECYKNCCKPCRMRVYQEGGIDCINCIKLLPDEAIQSLIELKQEVEELKNENRELKGVNKELEDVNKELQDEIKELKDKQGKSMMTE